MLAVAPPLRVVIYRRLMMRIAEALARRAKAQALVTGEVVGQVASQTLENLAAINSVATMPVLRPLVGMDKDEITAEAQRLGTLSDLDHPRPGLLHALHAASSGHEGPVGRCHPRAKRPSSTTSTAIVAQAVVAETSVFRRADALRRLASPEDEAR